MSTKGLDHFAKIVPISGETPAAFSSESTVSRGSTKFIILSLIVMAFGAADTVVLIVGAVMTVFSVLSYIFTKRHLQYTVTDKRFVIQEKTMLIGRVMYFQNTEFMIEMLTGMKHSATSPEKLFFASFIAFIVGAFLNLSGNTGLSLILILVGGILLTIYVLKLMLRKTKIVIAFKHGPSMNSLGNEGEKYEVNVELGTKEAKNIVDALWMKTFALRSFANHDDSDMC
eukprot:TRINITY_DN11511_c0_g1_i1.p1 TRINITY_DN11511_c0_g1~~TRINITY_DN11511_c0_g1_i1.p1  ORF type:complete len:228 (-),score=55.25 TRINITY_DN11511_c0_g1_i1:87-770(-)